MVIPPEFTGRRIIVAVVGATTLATAAVMIYGNVAHGVADVPRGLVRLATLCAVGYLLYRGTTWLRWLGPLLILIWSGGFFLAAARLPDLSYRVPLALLGAVYAIAASILAFHPAVARHLMRRRLTGPNDRLQKSR